MTRRAGLLAGLTVADFGWAVAGPVLGRFLAHHGADVIKIESNTRLDPTRMSPPFAGEKPSRNASGYYDQHNAGKRSVTINLKHLEGRRIARRLALWADVVNENFAVGVMDELGLGYESLKADRADLIMVSASMQGQSGPHALHPGLGVTLQGLVGICHLTGWPDREPVGTGQPYTDTLSSWLAGAALMAVLDYRRRTGAGAHVDFSQFEGAVHGLAPGLLHEQLGGVRHVRQGNASSTKVPHGVYACAGRDRWCAITVESDDEWRALASVIDFQIAGTALEQQEITWRARHAPEIDAAIEGWTRRRDPLSVQTELQAAGIAAYIVTTSRDLYEDRQLAARGHFVLRDHPRMGEHFYEMPPFRLDEHEIVVKRSALIGEHTDDVLSSCLGMTAAEIAAARETGALT